MVLAAISPSGSPEEEDEEDDEHEDAEVEEEPLEDDPAAFGTRILPSGAGAAGWPSVKERRRAGEAMDRRRAGKLVVAGLPTPCTAFDSGLPRMGDPANPGNFPEDSALDMRDPFLLMRLPSSPCEEALQTTNCVPRPATFCSAAEVLALSGLLAGVVSPAAIFCSAGRAALASGLVASCVVFGRLIPMAPSRCQDTHR